MVVPPVVYQQPYFPVEISLKGITTRNIIHVLQWSLLVETLPGTLDDLRVREADICKLDTIGRAKLVVALGRRPRRGRDRR